MEILILDTGLFPDRETVAAAIAELESGSGVERLDIAGIGADEAAWDGVARAVLAAGKVITI